MPASNHKSVCFVGDQPHPGDLNLTKYCLERSELPKKASILDVGCGSGQTVQYLQDSGYQALGIDLYSVQKLPTKPENSSYTWANWNHIPTRNNIFDAVFAECTLSLIQALDLHLSEVLRVLKPTGKLIFHGLYSRNDSPGLWLENLGQGCSLKNIRNQSQLTQEIQAAGFTLLFLEDQSQILKNKGKYLHNLCWSPNLFGQQKPQESENDIFDFFLTIAKLKLGYYVAIALRN
jgi:SAM-dependent methyltransferase